jgi:DNA-binding NarL/FixJ family response regulator
MIPDREGTETKMVSEETRAAGAPSRIVIADNHPLFRSAIRQILEKHPDLEVIGEVTNGREALEHCRRLKPELVLMDLRMPEMDGVAATRVIKREFPEVLVLILTAVDEPRSFRNSLEAGAAGYILKDASPAQITHAVRRVLAGGAALNDELGMQLLTSLVNRESHREEEDRKAEPENPSTSNRHLEKRGGSRPEDSLTPQEVEVLRLVVRGHTNQQIARFLSVSASTVKRHIRHIRSKFGVCDRVQVAVRAVELGVLDERSGG